MTSQEPIYSQPQFADSADQFDHNQVASETQPAAWDPRIIDDEDELIELYREQERE